MQSTVFSYANSPGCRRKNGFDWRQYKQQGWLHRWNQLELSRSTRDYSLTDTRLNQIGSRVVVEEHEIVVRTVIMRADKQVKWRPNEETTSIELCFPWCWPSDALLLMANHHFICMICEPESISRLHAPYAALHVIHVRISSCVAHFISLYWIQLDFMNVI